MSETKLGDEVLEPPGHPDQMQTQPLVENQETKQKTVVSFRASQSPGQTQSCCVGKGDTELPTLLRLPPRCWGYRYEPPYSGAGDETRGSVFPGQGFSPSPFKMFDYIELPKAVFI